VKVQKAGFTVVEILTVVTIIAVLVGILIPSITAVRTIARNTQQTAQLTTIALAISAFKNDYGDIPPSSAKNPANLDYSGTQKLTEALVGWDLMGFHPESEFNSDGMDDSDQEIYPPMGTIDLTDPDDEENLRRRMGPYLENATENVFRLGEVSADRPGIFRNYGQLAGDTYVICDMFKRRRIRIEDSVVRAGTPILYYRANTASKDHDTDTNYSERIYNVYDNRYLVNLRPVTENGEPSSSEHPLADSANRYEYFYEFIRDTRVTNNWPYRPDSYLLISAGPDGEYGTRDDITNFPLHIP
jgi:prepilin-type N-terminal cleavage/methylation domain-containing protein